MKSSTSQRAGSSRILRYTMYLTSGAKVMIKRSRSWPSPDTLYCFQSSSASSAEIRRRLGSTFIVRGLLWGGLGESEGVVPDTGTWHLSAARRRPYIASLRYTRGVNPPRTHGSGRNADEWTREPPYVAPSWRSLPLMALRLTTAKTAFETTRRPGEEALELGRAALASNDLKRYRELFAECAQEADYNRAYKARRTLIELGLEKLGGTNATAAAIAPLMMAIATGALDALDVEPCEPVLLNYAGIAFYELGSLKAAEALFKAARRLDPALPHVKKNLDEIGRRRRQGFDAAAALPANVAVPLKGLAVRGERVAQKAQPAEGLTLSLAMIVKDEEEMLPRCLAAVKDAVDEMIVVDTGSSDRTVEIAESFGAKVLHHEWTGDFSAARNVSFDAATSDWIVYLDADEVLVAEDAQRLRDLTKRTWREAFYLVETNFTGDLADGEALTHNALRVFRNRDAYRFDGRLHEQIANKLPAYNPERLESSSVRIEHYGYLASVRDAKEKSRRNIELLEQQKREGSSGPFLHFNLGSEYAAAMENEAALREFKTSWDLLQQEGIEGYGFVPSLMGRLVKAYRVNGLFADARRQADEGLKLFPGFTDLVFEQGHAYAGENRLAEAAEHFERAIAMG